MKLLRAKNNKSSSSQTVIIFRENFFIFFEVFFSISRQAYYGGFDHGHHSEQPVLGVDYFFFLLGVFTVSATMNQENKTQVSIVSQQEYISLERVIFLPLASLHTDVQLENLPSSPSHHSVMSPEESMSLLPLTSSFFQRPGFPQL